MECWVAWEDLTAELLATSELALDSYDPETELYEYLEQEKVGNAIRLPISQVLEW